MKTKNSKKEPIVTKGGIRLKLNYFSDVFTAIFNTREDLIFDARVWVINRRISMSEHAEIAKFDVSNIMSVFKETPTRVTRLFVFRLARLTDDFFASGDAAKENDAKTLRESTTADGLDFRTLKTLYFVNKFTDKIDEFDVRQDLRTIKGFNTIRRADGQDFDLFNSTLSARDFFGSQSAAIDAFGEYLKAEKARIQKQIGDLEKQGAEIQRLLNALEMDTAVYSKPPTGKKPETFGKIRI